MIQDFLLRNQFLPKFAFFALLHQMQHKRGKRSVAVEESERTLKGWTLSGGQTNLKC